MSSAEQQLMVGPLIKTYPLLSRGLPSERNQGFHGYLHEGNLSNLPPRSKRCQQDIFPKWIRRVRILFQLFLLVNIPDYDDRA
jgi:hypothetical protein